MVLSGKDPGLLLARIAAVNKYIDPYQEYLNSPVFTTAKASLQQLAGLGILQYSRQHFPEEQRKISTQAEYYVEMLGFDPEYLSNPIQANLLGYFFNNMPLSVRRMKEIPFDSYIQNGLAFPIPVMADKTGEEKRKVGIWEYFGRELLLTGGLLSADPFAILPAYKENRIRFPPVDYLGMATPPAQQAFISKEDRGIPAPPMFYTEEQRKQQPQTDKGDS